MTKNHTIKTTHLSSSWRVRQTAATCQHLLQFWAKTNAQDLASALHPLESSAIPELIRLIETQTALTAHVAMAFHRLAETCRLYIKADEVRELTDGPGLSEFGQRMSRHQYMLNKCCAALVEHLDAESCADSHRRA